MLNIFFVPYCLAKVIVVDTFDVSKGYRKP